MTFTAWTAAAITISTIIVAAQSTRRPAQSSLQSERTFAAELQRALRNGDRRAVMNVVRYPARVSVLQRTHPIYIEDRDALEQKYDMVFTPHVRCAVVGSREPVAGQAQCQLGHGDGFGPGNRMPKREADIVAARDGAGCLAYRPGVDRRTHHQGDAW